MRLSVLVPLILPGCCAQVVLATKTKGLSKENLPEELKAVAHRFLQSENQEVEPPTSGPLENDDCVNAVAITPREVATSSLTDASEDEPPVCTNQESGSQGVWYTFEGTGAIALLSTCADPTGLQYSETFVSVYHGSDCGNLECVPISIQDQFCGGFYYGGTSTTLVTDVGVSYYVFISDKFGFLSSFELTLTTVEERNNSQCTTSGDIEVDAGAVYGGGRLLPNGADVAACGSSLVSDTVAWYSFTATEDATLRASTCSPYTTGLSTALTIVGGDCDSQECIAESQPFAFRSGCGDNGNFVDFQATAGTRYSVVVSGPMLADVASFEIEVRTLNPPSNDLCANAEAVSLESTITGSIEDATISVDEVDFACSGTFNDTASGVWYSFVGTGEIVQTITRSNDYTPLVSTYSGLCGSLQCNAPASFSTTQDGSSDYIYSHRSNAVSTVLGETYLFLVASQDSGAIALPEGTFEFSMRTVIPAENDACEDAVQVFPDDEDVVGSTDGAIYDGFSGCQGNNIAPGVWFFVVGTGRPMRINTCFDGTNFDIVFSVYRGLCGQLYCVGLNYGCSSPLIFESELFVNYYIRVNGYSDFKFSVSPFEAAVNDDCTGAIELAMDVPVDGDMDAASGLDDSVDCAFNSEQEPGLWYYVDGRGTGVEVSTCYSMSNSTLSGTMYVFTGTSCLDLVCEPAALGSACPFQSTAVKFFAEAGVRYYLLFVGFVSSYTDQRFTIGASEFEIVDNDVCETADPIADPLDAFVVGSTLDALPDNSTCNFQGDFPAGVWYSFIGTGTPVVASTCTSELSFDSSVSVFSGSCDKLECVAFDSFSISGCEEASFGSARAVFRTEAGVEYFILVSGAYLGAVGDFALTMSEADLPDNDVCTEAIPLDLADTSILGSTRNATSFKDVNYTCFMADTPGVWYSLVGTGEVYALSTCSSELTFDSAISISTGRCNNAECLVSQAVNDFDCTQASFSATRAVVRTEVGVEYFIYVHGAFPGSKGIFELSIATVEVPPNDICSDAISVIPDSGSVFGSTQDATSSVATGCFYFGESPDLWYSVVGTGSGLTASLCGHTNYDSQIAVYEGLGDNCTASCIISNDDFGPCDVASQVTWLADRGVTYFVQVYGFSSNSGSFELNVRSNSTNN